MANIDLTLDVSDTLNPKIMRVYDTSFYYQDQTIDNYLLEVLPVNRTKWVTFYVSKGYSVTFNSSNLQYKKVAEEEGLIDLPDGVYEFRVSVKPNTLTMSEYFHLRTVEIMRKLCSERNKLFGDRCSLSRDEFIRNRDRLRDIEEYIYAAKWKIENCDCDERKKGIELYQFSQKLLEQYTNECQC